MNLAHQKPDISIVLPTFNEQNNVGPIVAEIGMAFAGTNYSYEVIFVDDSNDDTPAMVRNLQISKPNIRLIHREQQERTGLGTAVVTGIEAATADVVCCMDADLQHPPHTIIKMYEAMRQEGKNFAVASRMAEGGSSDGLANGFRHIVSQASKLVAYIILPLTRKTTDPMTGFFMMKRELIAGQALRPIGFKILVELLARVPAIDSIDVGFVMRKREFDESKASFKEGMRYFRLLITLMFDTPRHSIYKYFHIPVTFVGTKFTTIMITLTTLFILSFLYTFATTVIEVVLLTVSLLLIVQLLYTLYILIYAWDNGDRIAENASPKVFSTPVKSFTAVVPALEEAEVIPYTVRAVANIDYPEHLKETLVVLRDTDTETIAAAQKAIDELGKDNVRIELISGEPFNKPHHLNAALKIAKNEVICIFDAEDEPHPEIYSVVNTVMVRDSADVVQCGVQLMNFESNWYSMYNVLEYFLWFGSALHFYQRQGIIPLGGNTVFFKTHMVRDLGGWDMEGLTEDAEIGIRLSAEGANIRVVYDPKHATQEETPPTVKSFIKQRTRWSQGFLQVLARHREITRGSNFTLKKKILLLYILGWPRIHAFMFLYIPIALILSLFVKTHPLIALINITPLLLLGFYLIVQNVALYEFTRIYNKKWSWKLVPKMIIWFFPYQFLLSFSSFRAMVRQIKQQTSWEKTEHVNAHRAAPTEAH